MKLKLLKGGLQTTHSQRYSMPKNLRTERRRMTPDNLLGKLFGMYRLEPSPELEKRHTSRPKLMVINKRY